MIEMDLFTQFYPNFSTLASSNFLESGSAMNSSAATGQAGGAFTATGTAGLGSDGALMPHEKTSKTNLYIKGLPEYFTNDHLEDLVPDKTNVKSVKAALEEENKCKGYGFIDLITEESAEQTLAHIQTHHPEFIVKFAKENEKDSTNLYITNLPKSWTSKDSDKLEEIFNEFGPIQSAFIMLEKTTNKTLGVGFVRFVNEEDAQNALESLKNDPKYIEGSTLPLEGKYADKHSSDVRKRRMLSIPPLNLHKNNSISNSFNLNSNQSVLGASNLLALNSNYYNSYINSLNLNNSSTNVVPTGNMVSAHNHHHYHAQPHHPHHHHNQHNQPNNHSHNHSHQHQNSANLLGRNGNNLLSNTSSICGGIVNDAGNNVAASNSPSGLAAIGGAAAAANDSSSLTNFSSSSFDINNNLNHNNNHNSIININGNNNNLSSTFSIVSPAQSHVNSLVAHPSQSQQQPPHFYSITPNQNQTMSHQQQQQPHHHHHQQQQSQQQQLLQMQTLTNYLTALNSTNNSLFPYNYPYSGLDLNSQNSLLTQYLFYQGLLNGVGSAALTGHTNINSSSPSSASVMPSAAGIDTITNEYPAAIVNQLTAAGGGGVTNPASFEQQAAVAGGAASWKSYETLSLMNRSVAQLPQTISSSSSSSNTAVATTTMHIPMIDSNGEEATAIAQLATIETAANGGIAIAKTTDAANAAGDVNRVTALKGFSSDCTANRRSSEMSVATAGEAAGAKGGDTTVTTNGEMDTNSYSPPQPPSSEA